MPLWSWTVCVRFFRTIVCARRWGNALEFIRNFIRNNIFSTYDLGAKMRLKILSKYVLCFASIEFWLYGRIWVLLGRAEQG